MGKKLTPVFSDFQTPPPAAPTQRMRGFGNASAHDGRTDLSGTNITKYIFAGQPVLGRRKKGSQ